MAKLDTKVIDDGDYQIWLTAQDELSHASFDKVVFRVDNTLPSVEILTPNVDERVLRRIQISAIVSDTHLDSYRLDYTTDLASNGWNPVLVPVG